MKNILLGITGSIAAYKTPELIRSFRANGMSVRVVLSESAKKFVTKTTLQAVSSNEVRSSLWDEKAEAAMSHIELARWADCILVAPTTANFMSKLVYGSAEDLLSTLCVASEAPIIISPAMNSVMWANKAVEENKKILNERGVGIIEPEYGDQACGEIGKGRMPEPDVILDYIENKYSLSSPLRSKKILITAGPTREAIDPIRYISNRSSGKMGYAMASAFSSFGCDVTLISGPSHLPTPDGIKMVKVESTQEMFKAVHNNLPKVEIFISAAAVSDYQCDNLSNQKIKKQGETLSLKLTKSPDILSSVAEQKKPPFTVGFAAETENLKKYAKEKLRLKSLDMIIANKVGKNLGFDVDENAVSVFWNGGEKKFEKKRKTILAQQLVELITERFCLKLDNSKMKTSNVMSIR